MSPKGKWSRTTISNKLNVVLTAIICFMTVLNFVNTLVQSNSQSAQATALTTAINEVKLALANGTDQTRKAVESAINTGSDQLQQTLTSNQSAFSRMMEQNEVALNASISQGKQGLDASIKMSRRDQRPWITVARFELSAELEQGKEVSVRVWLQNTGKTPAMNEVNQSQVYLWPVPPVMTNFSKPQPKESNSITIIAPGAPATSFITTKWKPQDAFVTSYRSKGMRFFVHAKAWFSDSFGTPHWTSVCASHGFSEPLDEFEYCGIGNEVDPEQ